MQISKINTQSFKGWSETDKTNQKILSEAIATLPKEKQNEALKVLIELDRYTPNHDLTASKAGLFNKKLKLNANFFGLPSITVKQGVFKNKDVLSTLQTFRDKVMETERMLGDDIDFVSAFKETDAPM